MPHRRRALKGSFVTHFDELVSHFPAQPEPKHDRPPQLQERIDLHARLFRLAWQLDDPSSSP